MSKCKKAFKPFNHMNHQNYSETIIFRLKLSFLKLVFNLNNYKFIKENILGVNNPLIFFYKNSKTL